MQHIFKKMVSVLGVTAALGVSATVYADYPEKTVMLTLSTEAGTTLDIFGRALAEYASEKTGQIVVVENKPGAAGLIGGQYVARQKPDGYKLVLHLDTFYTVAPSVYENMNFKPMEELIPINKVGSFNQVLLASKKLNVSSYEDLLEKIEEQDLMYSSAGPGSPGHLTMEMLQMGAGFNLLHVPYKGNVSATLALYTGETDTGFLALGAAIPYVKSGDIIPLAVSGTVRDPSLPDVPTLQEVGGEKLKDFDVQYGFVVAAPKGTAPEIINYWNSLLEEALADPKIIQSFINTNLQPTYLSHEETKTYLNNTASHWGSVVNELGIKIK